MAFLQALTETSTALQGMILTLPSLTVAELVGQSGLDWVFIDMEHSALSFREVEGLLQVLKGQCYCVIRISDQSEAMIKRTIDLGCDGLIIPAVNSAEQAQKVVSYAKYAPVGQRSIGLTRSNGFGTSLNKSLNSANHAVALIAQIEHTDAVHEIDAILSIPGIDAAFIGPYDLSASLGKTGQLSDPKVQEQVAHIKAAANQHHKPLGIYAHTREASKQCQESGYDFIATGIDVCLLRDSIQATCLSS